MNKKILRNILNLKEKIYYRTLQGLKSNLIVTQKCFIENGKEIYNNQFKVSDSLVGNFLVYLYCAFSYGNYGNYTLCTILGSTYNQRMTDVNLAGNKTIYNYAPKLDAVSSDVSYGIVFGTGSTGVSPSDLQLETKIANGTGAGQMSYGVSQGTVPPTISGSVTSFTIQRSATNNSGSPIAVSEVGIYVYLGGSIFNFYRDLISPAQTVPNLQTLTVQITFEITT